MQEISYTTDEISKMLKVSKLTVYELIKKGELAAFRVGKQMRIEAADLEAYKQRSKRKARPSVDTAADDLHDSIPTGIPASRTAPAPAGPAIASFSSSHVRNRQLVITGQDISLDILAKQMEAKVAGTRPLRSYVGSLDSLISMYRGESDIVSTHLIDGDTGEYNLPYIRRLLVGFPYVVMNLLSRQAGLYVKSGNPLGLKQWSDLGTPGLTLVNREIGSGARVLLDEQLRIHRIAAHDIKGYDRLESNHIGVAGVVACGDADVGIGIEKAAAIVGNVDFIPLVQERYDLVMLKTNENLAWIESVVDIVRSDAYQNELRAIPGYDLTLTGRILYET